MNYWCKRTDPLSGLDLFVRWLVLLDCNVMMFYFYTEFDHSYSDKTCVWSNKFWHVWETYFETWFETVRLNRWNWKSIQYIRKVYTKQELSQSWSMTAIYHVIWSDMVFNDFPDLSQRIVFDSRRVIFGSLITSKHDYKTTLSLLREWKCSMKIDQKSSFGRNESVKKRSWGALWREIT